MAGCIFLRRSGEAIFLQTAETGCGQTLQVWVNEGKIKKYNEDTPQLAAVLILYITILER